MQRATFLTLLALAVGSAPAAAADFHVYYLGGQSNMDGYGFVSELPEDLRGANEDVWIFHGNPAKDGTPPDGRGLWSRLQPGHGRSFASDGKENRYSDRFGPELTFAKAMQEQHPDRRIALIKYSRGGTSIDAKASAAARFGCWDPEWEGGEGEGKGVNQFDHFLATLASARADTDIDDDGEPDRLIPAGILWMQGESDSQELEVAEDYRENLEELIEELREALGDDDIPVAIGRITDWKVWTHSDVLRAAQAEFVESDDEAALVTSTDGYGKSDKWHYDTAGYLDLGEQFAEALSSIASD